MSVSQCAQQPWVYNTVDTVGAWGMWMNTKVWTLEIQTAISLQPTNAHTHTVSHFSPVSLPVCHFTNRGPCRLIKMWCPTYHDFNYFIQDNRIGKWRVSNRLVNFKEMRRLQLFNWKTTTTKITGMAFGFSTFIKHHLANCNKLASVLQDILSLVQFIKGLDTLGVILDASFDTS